MASPLPSEKVTELIEKLLAEKDPATVGLRRILKQKQEAGKDYPLHSAQLKEFKVPGKNDTLFDDDQRRVLELEKELIGLRNQIEAQRHRAEAAIRTAYADGQAKGESAGIEQGKQQAKAAYDADIGRIQAQVHDYLKAFEDSKKRVYANAEHVLLKFCLQLVEKVLGTEVATNHDTILAVIKKSIGYIADREKMVIRVAPADFEHVSNKKDFWAPVADRLADITIEPDDRISAGGCMIDSNSGIVDARMGVQLAELSDLVEKTWESINSSLPNPAAPDVSGGS
jgi:flagellar biosynthesis/type III secretory pathway protein FliH